MVKASITLDGIAALTQEQIRTAGRAALRKVGRKWIDAYLPLHFTNVAYARYGYTKRKRGYDFKKRNRAHNGESQAIGEVKPLVWSGRSREGARRARFKLGNGSTTSVAGEVIINAPALNFKNPTSGIDMQDEVTRITQAEINDLGALFMSEFERELERAGKRARKKLAA